MKTSAYCWATGLIEFGTTVPDDAIEIARGDDKLVRHLIDATARHDYQDKPLVPGVPEATLQRSKGDALGAYLLWIKGREQFGLAVAVHDDAKFNPFYAGSHPRGSYFTLVADDRIRLVKHFNVHQCRAALRVRRLQKTVRAAIERRLRALVRAAASGVAP